MILEIIRILGVKFTFKKGVQFFLLLLVVK